MNIKKKIFKLAASYLVLSVGALVTYASLEPMYAGAQASASDTVIITLNVTAGISITSPADATMSTAVGVAQNSAVATTTWNVKTNNNLGYTLAVKATSTPAMQSSTNTIGDDQTGAPAFWSTPFGTYEFGYSAFGTDVPTGTWGTGSLCSTTTNAHATSTTLKYKGFTTSDVTIATRSSTTTTSGVDSTVCYAVEQNNSYIPSGTYKATIVATATTI